MQKKRERRKDGDKGHRERRKQAEQKNPRNSHQEGATDQGVSAEGVSFSALLPLRWSSPAKGNRPILPHE